MSPPPTSRAIIDLDAYAHNLRLIRSLIPGDCAILAVIKANAYGHGMVPIAQRAAAEGVDMIGVATVEEGVRLKEAGCERPILVFVQPAHEAIPAILEHQLRILISDIGFAETLGEAARKINMVLPVHVKIDSGMGRQGFAIETAERGLRHLARISNIDIEGVATHFPTAEYLNDAFTLGQIKAFRSLLKQLDKAGIPYERAHAANSAAIMNYNESHLDMVRPGLMTYGVWPTARVPEDSPLWPVMRWECPVVLIKEFEPGASIGYGRTYTTTSRMRAAVLPVGYADGYPHSLSNRAEVLIHGQRCPVRGSVCMDQIVVDITKLRDVAPGDTATLIGGDGKEFIAAEELAERAQTIPYEILAGIGPRVHREYVP